MKWLIEIPGYIPPTVNEWRGRHWSKRHKLNVAFDGFLTVYAGMAGVPKVDAEYKPCRGARLTVGMPLGKGRSTLPDPDAFLKDWLDGMKRCRLIVDDAQKWCRWERPALLVAPNPFTLITLEDV